jgi:DNA (cytosine-5)-methyltransferase 1
VTPIRIADLFCGAGGTSTGAVQAARAVGHAVELTAVNHWDRAVATHTANHPEARHLCASVDSLNPHHLYPDGHLDILWASPECTHHSRARGGKPMNDQSRATAWCVTRWADALLPCCIMVENVPEFEEWGPLDEANKPVSGQKGRTFHAWVETLRALGYTVDWRKLCAADYGDPTTRTRLFVQAVRGDRRIVWPEPTHTETANLWGAPRWRPAADIIDWSIPTPSIADRKRPLAPKTLARIREGLRRYGGGPFIVAMEHKGRTVDAAAPLPTVTCAKGGAMGVAYLLPQQSDGRLRRVDEPAPTVSTAGAIALVVEYYGNGQARPVTEPLPTVTCNDRFALLELDGSRIGFRMLQPHELAAAQGFPQGYQFTGNKTEQVRQIGNAVPCGFSRALIAAHLTGNGDVRDVMRRAANTENLIMKGGSSESVCL